MASSIGDEIMYAPCVLGLVRAGARCVLECEPRLERMFAQAFPECLILHREDREQIVWHAGLPEIDFCISALSLPLYFAHPLDRRSFLKADAGRADYWRQRLQESGPGLKVGVSWRGGADAKVRGIRSIPESIFGQLIEQGATFVSLQYGATAAEAAAVSKDLLHFSEIDPLRDLDEFSVSWTPEMVNCFASLAEWGAGEGFAVEILSGAKAFLASDEVGFVEQMVRALEAKKVAHILSFPVSELAWLAAIGSASLVVSGRFHYSIAAAFQRVPFLVAESNTSKIAGLLSELGLEAAAVTLGRGEYGSVARKARHLLLGDNAGTAAPGRLDELRARARENFSSL